MPYPLQTLSQLRPVLQGFRKAQGYTQQQVAARLGITQQSYAQLEANPASASVERLFRVLQVLGIQLVLDDMTSTSAFVLREPEVAYTSPGTATPTEDW